jgi:hypothetical protein
MRYGAAGTGSPLHRSVKQTIALPEELNVRLVTSSVLPPSSLRIVFSAAGPMPLVNIWRRLRREIFDSYRPELHYMRGPGPRWREKHPHVPSALSISRQW